MKFKNWLKLQEVGTGTNAIAQFVRPIGIGTCHRPAQKMIWIDSQEDKTSKKKKKS